MHEAISTQRDQIMSATRTKADSDARNIGVEIVDVRLRRIELPADAIPHFNLVVPDYRNPNPQQEAA